MHGVAWRGMWICVRSKDAQKQFARTSLNSIVFLPLQDLWYVFSFFFFNFCSLTLAFTNCQIKEDQNNEKYFNPNETKTSMMFQQLDLV